VLPVLLSVLLHAFRNVTLYSSAFVVVIYPPSFHSVSLYHVYSLYQNVHCPHFELYFRNGIGSVDPFSGNIQMDLQEVGGGSWGLDGFGLG
jgi:hypothetical protein